MAIRGWFSQNTKCHASNRSDGLAPLWINHLDLEQHRSIVVRNFRHVVVLTFPGTLFQLRN